MHTVSHVRIIFMNRSERNANHTCRPVPKVESPVHKVESPVHKVESPVHKVEAGA